MWMVMAVKESITVQVSVFGAEQEIPLEWADGMVGSLPLFKLKYDAKRYAGKKFEIIEVKVME